MKNSYSSFAFLVLFSTAFFIQCHAVNVAFVLISPVGNAGWILGVEKGRLAFEENNKGNNVTTVAFQGVSNGEPTRTLIDNLATNGTNIIVFSVYVYVEDVHRAAQKYPDVFFILYDTQYPYADKNVGSVNLRIYEAQYLSGIIAGLATKTNTFGFVSCCKDERLIRDVSAFTIGAEQVNKNVKVYYAVIGGVFDPIRETSETEEMITLRNADVITQATESIFPMMVAKNHSKFAFGWASDMQSAVGPEIISSIVVDWAVALQYQLDLYLSGDWKNTSNTRITWGVKEGLVKLAPFSNLFVPANHPNYYIFERERDSFRNDSARIFCGDVAKQLLAPSVPAGDCLTRAEIDRITNQLPNNYDHETAPYEPTDASDEDMSVGGYMKPLTVLLATFVSGLIFSH